MGSSLILGKYVVCGVRGRSDAEIVADGAVFQRDGTIIAVGKSRDLAEKYRPDDVIGSDRHLVLPGFVNAHHHIGLTPLQLGTPDDALELWIASRIATRDVDLYLDTLYAAFEMVQSGITTVQHLHGWTVGPLDRVHEAASRILRAYQDIGMRVSYSYMTRDQNQLVHLSDEEFVRRLPADLGREVMEYLSARALSIEDQLALFEDLHGKWSAGDRARIQLAPHNLHWCSDKTLTAVRACAEKYAVPMHMHLLESPYQKEYAGRRGGAGAVRHLHDLGLLGPAMTLGHAVWLTQADIDIVAETGTRICHNCSSNLRLRSGIAPVNLFEDRGIPVALGIDEAGINDDRDMLQEMRMALLTHRVPGMADAVPTAAQVLRMATERGAHTTPFGARLGTIEPGKAADLVVMDWKHLAFPYLDETVPIVDAIVHRARAVGVETVLVAGEPVLRDGRFTRIDKDAALAELAARLALPLRPDEKRRREISRHLLPYVRSFYDRYLEGQAQTPFYHRNSRI